MSDNTTLSFNKTVHAQVQQELTEIFLSGVLRATIFVVVTCSALVYCLKSQIPLFPLSLWGAFLCLLAGVRAGICYLINNTKEQSAAVESLLTRLYGVVTGMTGFSWGLLAILPHAVDSDYSIGQIFIVMMGVIPLATNALSPHRLVQVVYIIPLPVVLSISLYCSSHPFALELSIASLLFLLFMCWVGKQQHEFLVHNLTLRFTNENLIHQLEEAVQRETAANMAKSEFLANMSHEIRTPLNGVLGMIDLLRGTQLSVEQSRLAKVIKESGETLLAIINDILDFSKIEAGKFELETISFDLRCLLEDVTQLLAPNAHAKGINLCLSIPEDACVHLKGDPTRLRQILTNLIGNAIKFTEQGEVVVLATLEKQDKQVKVQLSVRDTGIGIAPEARLKLFNPFVQADSSTTRKYGGSGLGLVISKELVERMNGTLDCKSELGKGSDFFFTLHLEIDQELENKIDKNETVDIQGSRVLIIDDNSTNIEILENQTAGWGVRNESACSGKKGLEKLQLAKQAGDPFDVVIVDLHMPEMDGLGVAKRIKDDPTLANVHILVLTSIGLRGDAKDMKEHGVSVYLTKPVRQSDLYSSLVTVLGHSNEHDALPLVTRQTIAEDIQQLKLNVLVVEDNLTNQEVAVGMLQKLGCRAYLASHGQEAIEDVKNRSFDIVLMDCQMPVMDGYQATTAIRQMEDDNGQGEHIPIIALTAHIQESEKEKCSVAGMDDFLTKPLSVALLMKTLVKWSGGQEKPSMPDESTTAADSERVVAELQIDAPENDSVLDHSVIDQKVLDGLRDLQIEGQPDILTKVISAYLDSTDSIFNDLKEAVAGNNLEKLYMASHGFKSSSANVGALKLSEMCKELEMTCKRKTLTNGAEMLSKITSEFVQVKEALTREMSSE